ncbi:MAG: polysaccharide ABC transporter ATP-binding protein [Pseudohongiellaceae bacterium]
MERISVQNLNKEFRIYERPQDRLAELLTRSTRHTLYHVLKDISFSVMNGKSLGIIGDNGAGKSTLLKLLVGTLQPTSGHIRIDGQVAALLELGAGFHPEFTGRKNIFLNASLLGVPDDNIAELEKDIIEFSELDYFIDRPVKTYSTGMFVRLAFSIATMVRPDVLVIDEALSVGDLAFQRKCVERMNLFREQQKTMVFCSHSMYHIQQLCDNAIWIDKGQIREIGGSDEIVGHYEDYCNNKKVYHSITEDIKPDGSTMADEALKRDCRILYVSVQSPEGEDLTTIEPLSDLILKMEVEMLNDNVEGNFGFAFMRSGEDAIASFLTTDEKNIQKGPFKKGDRIFVTIKVDSIAMRVGHFYILGGVADKSGLLWYETKPSKPLQMAANKGVGSIAMKYAWSVEKLSG